jgi:hypothetical protein
MVKPLRELGTLDGFYVFQAIRAKAHAPKLPWWQRAFSYLVFDILGF